MSANTHPIGTDYGGMILSTWLDRPLSVAGRLIVKGREGMESKLVNLDKDAAMIPNVAIHMNKDMIFLRIELHIEIIYGDFWRFFYLKARGIAMCRYHAQAHRDFLRQRKRNQRRSVVWRRSRSGSAICGSKRHSILGSGCSSCFMAITVPSINRASQLS